MHLRTYHFTAAAAITFAMIIQLYAGSDIIIILFNIMGFFFPKVYIYTQFLYYYLLSKQHLY